MVVKLSESVIKRAIKDASEEIFPTKKTSLYECINRASSWSEGQKLNSFPKIEVNESKILLSEGVVFESNSNERGGIIVLSTDVNAVKLSNNQIADWLKQRSATLKNRVKATSKIDKLASKNGLVGQ